MKHFSTQLDYAIFAGIATAIGLIGGLVFRFLAPDAPNLLPAFIILPIAFLILLVYVYGIPVIKEFSPERGRAFYDEITARGYVEIEGDEKSCLLGPNRKIPALRWELPLFRIHVKYHTDKTIYLMPLAFKLYVWPNLGFDKLTLDKE